LRPINLLQFVAKADKQIPDTVAAVELFVNPRICNILINREVILVVLLDGLDSLHLINIADHLVDDTNLL